MEPGNRDKRIWELDFFRGIALILMIYFHIVFDMRDIFGYDVTYSSGINFYLGKISAILFMLLSGISCYLSRSNIRRGLKVVGIALVLTVATHLYSPELGVKFGILHFLGVCMLLAPVFQKLNRYVLILLGILSIVIGNLFTGMVASNDYLFISGIYSENFVSSDYYPLFPWLGVFLFGMAFGQIFYSNRKSIFNFNLGDNLLSRMGRHTLMCYIVHQPLIILVLTLINTFVR